MKKVKIKLSTIDDVKNFVNKVTGCSFDVDLISGRYAIDAKSIMGIFSLDLSKPIEAVGYTDDNSFEEAIKDFIV